VKGEQEGSFTKTAAAAPATPCHAVVTGAGGCDVSKGEAPPFTLAQGHDQASHRPGDGEVDDCVVVGERPVSVSLPTTTLPLPLVAYPGHTHAHGPHHPHRAPSTPNFGYHTHHPHHHHHTAPATVATAAAGYCYPHAYNEANLLSPPQKTTTSPSSPSPPPAATGSHDAGAASWATAHNFGLALPQPPPSEFCCCEGHRHFAQ
jgi:hypothetical protein